jgi:hypothetical protein
MGVPRFRLRKAVLCAGVLLLGAPACGSSSENDIAKKDRELAELRQELDLLIPNASQTQRDALSDGVVTRAEADVLAAEVVDCAEASGVEVVPEWNASEGWVQFSVRAEPGDGRVEIYEQCKDELFDVADRAMALQNSLSGAQQKTLSRRR